MRNKYPGPCYRCGKRVEVGEGHFEGGGRMRGMLGQWRVQHAECAKRWRGTDKKAGDGKDNHPAEHLRWDIARREYAERQAKEGNTNE